MQKNVSVMVAGSGETRDVSISPATTVRELLEATGLQGYMVSTGPDKPFLASDEDVYRSVATGAKLYASTPAEAGFTLISDHLVAGGARA